MTTIICAEVELILCCARTDVDPEATERIRILLQKNLDWAYLIQVAVRHGVMPLLYWSLSATCPEVVPEAILVQLHRLFQTNEAHNRFLTGELLKLLDLLEENGILSIPFKGSVLAASIYGNFALRQFCDLDILVREQDIKRAEELLILQGYRLINDLSWQKQLVNFDNRVTVDLHQAIAPEEFPSRLNFEGLWERLEPLSLAGTTVFSFSPEDLLSILCTNLARDCWQERERLGQICDIAELLRVYPGIDWKQLLEQSQKLGCERMLLLGLLLAQELFGVRLPEGVAQRIQSQPVLKSLASQVCEWLFCEVDSLPRGVEKKLFYFRVRERLRDTLPYLIHLVHLWIAPSQKDRAFIELPVALSLLYYLVRPIRLLEEYGLRPIKHLQIFQYLGRRIGLRKL